MIGRVRVFLIAALLLPGSGAAIGLCTQQRAALGGDSVVVDRIVAVVGSKAILSSHVEERLLQEFPQGKGLPTAPDSLKALRRDLLKLLINEELMVQEAGRDTTIKVPEEDVTKSVDALIKSARAKYPSEDAYRNDLRNSGFETADEYRSWLTEQQRRALLRRELLSKQRGKGAMKAVSATEKEIREYYDRNKAYFPPRGATISFRQIITPPPAKAEAKARAFALADSILTELRKGGDFATAAKRFSMDPGSKEAGGELGWTRRGQNLDQHFEDVAFSLRPGVISDPVETVFGYHLIQVERTQPAEVQVRHILIMPVIDSTDADSAGRIAANLHAALERGASFDSLQRIWHDKTEERELIGYPLDSLPGPYHDAVEGVAAGQISNAFLLPAPGDPLRSKRAILLVTERLPAGPVRYEDVKEQIRSLLSEDLTQQRYIDKLRAATLVEVRSP
ncbi:MAG TPA: peptidylprolyl isomerase [Gemmatimonadales bacterium]|nr:peptidylprolyl isomerase [Gemmatimonadales bacterium]